MRRCCPICGKETDFETRGKPNSPHPFCSERCRWIDLSHWFEGTYQLQILEELSSNEQSPVERPGSGRNSIDRPEEL